MTSIVASGPLLALDTGTPVASVAVLGAGGRVLARQRDDARNHGPTLLGTIEQTLAAAHLGPRDLVAVACGRGPGSFTGLRIGLSTAKGICFALDIPLLLPSSLEAMALQVARHPDAATREALAELSGTTGMEPERRAEARRFVVVPCLDARRKELFVAAYGAVPASPESLEVLLGPMAASAEVVANRVAGLTRHGPVLLVGNGVQLYQRVFAERLGSCASGVKVLPDATPGTPDAGFLGHLAQRMLAAGEVADLDAAEPEYLRPSDAELSWQKRFGASPEQTGPRVLGQGERHSGSGAPGATESVSGSGAPGAPAAGPGK